MAITTNDIRVILKQDLLLFDDMYMEGYMRRKDMTKADLIPNHPKVSSIHQLQYDESTRRLSWKTFQDYADEMRSENVEPKSFKPTRYWKVKLPSGETQRGYGLALIYGVFAVVYDNGDKITKIEYYNGEWDSKDIQVSNKPYVFGAPMVVREF